MARLMLQGQLSMEGQLKQGETGLIPKSILNNNDSYNFFKKIDRLFITGPTGTNVMDIQIIAVIAP
jgi:glycerate-2-kinase